MDENENILNFELPEGETIMKSFQMYRDPHLIHGPAKRNEDEFSSDSDSESSLYAENDSERSENMEKLSFEAEEKYYSSNNDIKKFYGKKQKRTSFDGSLSDPQKFEWRNAKRICTGIFAVKPESTCKENDELESEDMAKWRHMECALLPDLCTGASNSNPSVHVDATEKQLGLLDEKEEKSALKRQRASSPALSEDDNMDVFKKLKIEDSPMSEDHYLFRKFGN